MSTLGKNARAITGLFALLLVSMGLMGVPVKSSCADDLSQKAKKTGKSIDQSARHAAHKTGKYLKSEQFHHDLKKAVNGTADAIRNGGNWVGHKLDSGSKPDPSKQ
ncbi:MAG: hypothetical protein ACYCTV_11550 [Leptospirales bacterium]